MSTVKGTLLLKSQLRQGYRYQQQDNFAVRLTECVFDLITVKAWRCSSPEAAGSLLAYMPLCKRTHSATQAYANFERKLVISSIAGLSIQNC